MYGNAYELMLHLSLIAYDLWLWWLQLLQQHSPLSAALNITDEDTAIKWSRNTQLLRTRDNELKQLTATSFNQETPDCLDNEPFHKY